MPGPYDYTTQAAQPIQAGLQGLQAGMGIAQQAQQMQAVQQKQQRQQQYRQQSYALSQNPNASAQDYVDLQAQYPEFAEGIKALNSARSDAQIRGDLNIMQKVNAAISAGQNDLAIEQLNEYSTALKNSGREDEAAQVDSIAEAAKKDPASVKSSLYQMLLAMQGPDEFIKSYQQQQSMGGAFKTQKSEILPDGSTIQVLNNGDVKVKDAEGNIVTGKDAAETILRARKYGVQLAKDINYNKETGRWEGQKDIRAEVEAEVTTGKEQAKGKEKIAQDLIQRGVLAAESVAGLKRGIELLDQVKTGGPRAVALRVKQLFGIETADEGELSNQLSKSVLGQLRETFGAAFTENEGKRLERIEASFTKSPETNKRLLQQAMKIAQRTAKRARAAAEKRDDMDTVADIDDLLEFSLNPNAPEQRTTELRTQPEQPAGGNRKAQLFNRLMEIQRSKGQ